MKQNAKAHLNFKRITSKLFNKQIILKTKLHTVTIETLKEDGFIVMEDDSMTGIKGVALIPQNNIIQTEDGSISLIEPLKEIVIYNDSEEVRHKINRLKKTSDVLVRVYLRTENVPITDVHDYNAMKTLYDEAIVKKKEIKSDKDLYNYITKQRIPQLKLIKAKRKCGRALFKGSSIRELEFDILICHDMNLILDMKVVDK